MLSKTCRQQSSLCMPAFIKGRIYPTLETSRSVVRRLPVTDERDESAHRRFSSVHAEKDTFGLML